MPKSFLSCLCPGLFGKHGYRLIGPLPAVELEETSNVLTISKRNKDVITSTFFKEATKQALYAKVMHTEDLRREDL